MSKRIAFVPAGLFLLLTGFAPPVAGQDERADEVRLRDDCRLAAQVLTTGEPANKTQWAMGVIPNCAHEGPPALVKLWTEVSNDSAKAEAVLDVSSRLRDERIADAATEIATDRSKPDAVRLAAIILLLRYADPYTGLSVPLLIQPDGWTPGHPVRSISGGRSPHKIPQTTGEISLSETFVSRIVSTLRQLCRSDPSPRIQYVTAALASRLERDIASGYVH